MEPAKNQGDELLIMQNDDGLSLKQVSRTFRGEGRLIPVDLSLEIVIGAAESLGLMHQESLPMAPHGQVNPSSLKLLPDGTVNVLRPPAEDPKLAQWTPSPDFSMTQGTIESVLSYLAPEQLPEGAQAPLTSEPEGAGPHPAPDHRADQFALGLIAVELLIGRPVYDAPTLTLMGEQVKAAEVRPALARVEATFPALFPVLAKALSLDPEGRYPTMENFARDLRPLAAAAVPSDITLGKMVSLVKSGEPAPHICGRSIPWQVTPPPTQLPTPPAFPWQEIDAGLPPEPVALQETGEFQIPEGAGDIKPTPAAYKFDPEADDDAITEAMAQGHLLGPEGTLSDDTQKSEAKAKGEDPAPRFSPGNHRGHRSPEALRIQASKRLMKGLPQREDDLSFDDLDELDAPEPELPEAKAGQAPTPPAIPAPDIPLGPGASATFDDGYEDAVTQPFIPLALAAKALKENAKAKETAKANQSSPTPPADATPPEVPNTPADPWESAATDQLPASTAPLKEVDELGAPDGFFITGNTGRGDLPPASAPASSLILPKDDASNRGFIIGAGLLAAALLLFFFWPGDGSQEATSLASNQGSEQNSVAGQNIAEVSSLTGTPPKQALTTQGEGSAAIQAKEPSTGPSSTGPSSAAPAASASKKASKAAPSQAAPMASAPPLSPAPEPVAMAQPKSATTTTGSDSSPAPSAPSIPVKPVSRPKGLETVTVKGRIMPGQPPSGEVLALGGAPSPEADAPPAMGTFSLRSFPQATSIFLGDQDLSAAIRQRTPLPTGSHTLIVKTGDGQEAAVKVTIRPDTWHRYIYNFEEQSLDEKGEPSEELGQRP